MTSCFNDPDYDSLPGIIPVFPLTGAFLLPTGYLPLNVFEPRYLNMLDDALAGNRLIGMVQPEAPENDPIADAAALYPIGCLGRIISFEESGDGPVAMSLKGIIRFRIKAELDLADGGCRRVRPDFSPYQDDLDVTPGALADRPRLMASAQEYFDHKDIHIDWESVDDVDGASLVTALAMICPLEPREKQALLEAMDHNARARLLSSLMEMALHGHGRDDDRVRH